MLERTKTRESETTRSKLTEEFLESKLGKVLFPCYSAYQEISKTGNLTLEDPEGNTKRLLIKDLKANLKCIALVLVPALGAAFIHPAIGIAELSTIPGAIKVKKYNLEQGKIARRFLAEKAGMIKK